MNDIFTEVVTRMDAAGRRYGDFASTHEALGVAVEEGNEFQQAIQSNVLDAVEHEAMDLAAVLIRLTIQLRQVGNIHARSMKSLPDG